MFRVRKVSALLVDCVVSVVFLLQCHKYINNKCMILLLNDKTQQLTIVIETRLLIACSIIRLVFDFVFYLAFPTYYRIYEPKGSCILDETSPQFFFSFGYLLIGSHLCHHVPIIVVTNIFKPKKENSLLLDTNSSFADQAEVNIFS
jgi:hypothetical protein